MKNVTSLFFSKSKIRRELDSINARLSTTDDLVRDNTYRIAALLQQIEKVRTQIDEQAALFEHQLGLQREMIGALTHDMQKAFASLRPKRLFISTGFFATAMAACIAANLGSEYDNYLLVTLDRQDDRLNREWAYSAYDKWVDVAFVSHTDYYVRTDSSPTLPFTSLEFDAVFSPFPRMHEFVAEHYQATDYRYYDEGLASCLELIESDTAHENRRFYSLSPFVVRHGPGIAVPVDAGTFREICLRNSILYRIPLFENDRNVVVIVAGIPRNLGGDPAETLVPYDRLVEALVAKGIDVWIKPHPRVAIEDVFAGSNLASLGAKLLETDSPLIECILARNSGKVSAIVSTYSSALMHAMTVFDVPAFSVDLPPDHEGRYMWKPLQDAALPNAKLLFDAHPDAFAAIARAHHNLNLARHLASSRNTAAQIQRDS
ncbi:alpha-2,8-polysialyltransferase family protein [Burkholderia multivorans]|uniref:alpha-2,8-polysialyltransferase family protein n=1 Tax=Burkholderia multivorans TaxID=87883 RepID=UPI001C251139|nr:alpha-2,8-polysialyltransferase family protein [Burkholderia multivorans]MBU9680240.1 alpha-2,8-polysialyltransferase family protein [Burkholderia multivorans]